MNRSDFVSFRRDETVMLFIDGKWREFLTHEEFEEEMKKRMRDEKVRRLCAGTVFDRFIEDEEGSAR